MVKVCVCVSIGDSEVMSMDGQTGFIGRLRLKEREIEIESEAENTMPEGEL